MTLRPLPESAVGDWDHEADVIVVGYGISGVCAALAAQEGGADVLVLERGGGSEGLCGGVFYLGGGTAMQKAMGWDDTPEAMEAMLRVALGPGMVDEAKLREYCAGSVAHFDWLVASGVPFTVGPDEEGTVFTAALPDGYVSMGSQHYEGGGLIWAGGEGAYPNDQAAVPVPRGHIARGVPADEDLYEGAATRALLRSAEARGIKALYQVDARRLIVDEDAAVVGVECRTPNGLVRVRARAGVILTTGGFVMNDEMLVKHAPQAVELDVMRLGHEGQDGLGIRMGQAAGAEAIHMDCVDVTLMGFTPPIISKAGLLINGAGQRFINEDTYYGRIGIEVFRESRETLYLLLEDSTYFPEAARRRPRFVAETIEELEGEAGLPPGSLVSTVELYNAHAAKGEDPLFHKRPPFVKPIVEPPFGLIDLSPVPAPGGGDGVNYVRTPNGQRVDVRSLAVMTLGGLKTTIDSEVVDLDGQVLPGLYAAGRCSAGLAVYGYCSGISLGDGSFFGARAGRAAAARAAALR